MSEKPARPDFELIERSDDVVVHISTRRFMDEESSVRLNQTIASLVERRVLKIYIDLQSLEAIGRPFFSTLITSWRRVVELDGRFVLARIPPCIMEIFELTRLTHVFDIRAEIPFENVTFASAEEQGFIHGIRQAGDDPSVSLIYSDWLEERDDDRAELIRLQCERETTENPERVDEMLAREKALLSQHEQRWVGSLAGIARDWSWRHGSIHQVTVSTSALEDHIDDLFKLAPIRQLSICGGYLLPQFRQNRWVEAFKRTESVNELSELVIQTRNLTDQDVEPMLESGVLTGLTRLDLAHQSQLSVKTIQRFRRKFGSAFKEE